MKNFVKAMDKESVGVEYRKADFSQLSDTKLKEDIFIDYQIRKLITDLLFKEKT